MNTTRSIGPAPVLCFGQRSLRDISAELAARGHFNDTQIELAAGERLLPEKKTAKKKAGSKLARKNASLMIGVGVPLAYLLYFVKDRAWVLFASPLFLGMSGCLLLIPLGSHSQESTPVGFLSMLGLLQICWMAVILFSPLQQLTQRLSFVVFGVLTLVALSEISKLNLHQYLQPPKVSENSLR